jgi:nucleoid-associated protein YgaU
MTNPIEQLLLAGATGPRFPANSRYHAVATREWTGPDGRARRFLRRRFLPQPDALAAEGHVRLREGDRLDLVAAARLGDPERFWRIADANGAMHPADLTAPGRVLRIPQAAPGAGGG